MYLFEEKINFSNFWRFDKQLVRTKRWARLPSATKRIYPVIAVHANKEGIAWPSQETVAIITGCTEKTVREGIKGLFRLPNHKIERYVTSRGNRGIKYRFPIAPDERGRIFNFHKSVIDGGNWHMLKPTAQALYPVVKTFSYFDYYEYLESLNDKDADKLPDATDFFAADFYKERKWDFLNADLDVLAEYAGIGSRSVNNALENLEERNLVVSFGDCHWKVMTVPRKYYIRDFLNGKIGERYGAKLVA